MTKSKVKAKDYDVKVVVKGDEFYVGLEDVLIGEKPLSYHLGELKDLKKKFNDITKYYSDELERINLSIGELKRFNVDNDNNIKRVEKVVEKAIKDKLKVGF